MGRRTDKEISVVAEQYVSDGELRAIKLYESKEEAQQHYIALIREELQQHYEGNGNNTALLELVLADDKQIANWYREEFEGSDYFYHLLYGRGWSGMHEDYTDEPWFMVYCYDIGESVYLYADLYQDHKMADMRFNDRTWDALDRLRDSRHWEKYEHHFEKFGDDDEDWPYEVCYDVLCEAYYDGCITGLEMPHNDAAGRMKPKDIEWHEYRMSVEIGSMSQDIFHLAASADEAVEHMRNRGLTVTQIEKV